MCQVYINTSGNNFLNSNRLKKTIHFYFGILAAALLLADPFEAAGQGNTDTTSGKLASEARLDTTVKKKFTVENISVDKELGETEKKLVERGDILFSLGPLKYEKALDYYIKAFKRRPDNSTLNFKLGFCFLHINKYKSKSIHFLERAINISQNKSDVDIRYYLGRAYQVNHDAERAIFEYEKYIEEVKARLLQKAKEPDPHLGLYYRSAEKKIDDANQRIKECKNWQKLSQNPIKARITNLGDSVNSPNPDYDPYISSDETTLIFTSRRKNTTGSGKADIDGEYYEDIYISKKRPGRWWGGSKQMGGGLNKSTNDAIVGLSHDGTKMLIYRDVGNGDIFMAERSGDSWMKLKNLRAINSKHHESSATFSPDYKSIYFVSDRPGGEGGRDIYVSKMDEKNRYGKPVNLGPEINTQYDEERIYLHSDGKTLIFSSKGHEGMGGYDIFISVNRNGKWSKPENLGYPINDVDDDYSFVLSANMNHGYYSSYKEDGKGEKDIYMVNFIDTTGTDNSYKPFAAKFNLDNAIDSLALFIPGSTGVLKKDSAVLAQKEVKTATMTMDTVAVKPEQKEMVEKLPSDLKMPESKDTLALKDKQEVLVNEKSNSEKKEGGKEIVQEARKIKEEVQDTLAMKEPGKKLEEKGKTEKTEKTEKAIIPSDPGPAPGEKIVFNDILFDFDKSILKEEGIKELTRLTQYLKDNRAYKVKITGHTDAKGTDEYNFVLSQKRMYAVYNFLLGRGILEARMELDYKGESQPAAPNENPDGSDNPEGRRLNRRSTIEIKPVSGKVS